MPSGKRESFFFLWFLRKICMQPFSSIETAAYLRTCRIAVATTIATTPTRQQQWQRQQHNVIFLFRRFVFQEEYSIDLQSGKKPYNEGDHAPNPLFKFVDEDVFTRPTYAAFIKLLVRIGHVRI